MKKINFFLLSALLLPVSAAAAPSCPLLKTSVSLSCLPGGNQLSFLSHTGFYVLSGSSVQADLVGSKELVCRYLPEQWSSRYRMNRGEFVVTAAEGLRALIERTQDISSDDKKNVSFGEPFLVLRYPINWLGGLGGVEPGISLGLDFLKFSDSSDQPQLNKTVIVIDGTSYDAGFGGTYRTGENCRLSGDF